MELQSQPQFEPELDALGHRRVTQESSGVSPSGSARLGRAPSRSAALAAEKSGLPSFCTSIAESTPGILAGDDRINYLMERLSQIDVRDRMALRTYFEQFLSRMAKVNASDLDMGGPTSTGLVWYRIDGDKKPDFNLPRFSTDECTLLILGLLSKSNISALAENNSTDFSYELPTASGMRRRRFRATAYMDMGALALNMRAITNDLRPLKSLAFHPSVERGLMFRHIRDGLTLITGVTGSGKSSTLDSIVDANNSDVNGHVVVIGRPIEYVHESKKCIVRHREVGVDVPSFKHGIVQALRQDPDIVVIGEMRDPDTISAALEITDSGHKVFSTLHTSSAVESIDRIIAEYPPSEQDRVRFRLAEVLRCIVSQKLVPKVGGGRILAKEVLWMTPSASAAIKNNNTNEIYQMMYEGWNVGQITLEQDLYRLMRQGQIAPDVAMNYANNKRRFQQLAQ
ncbi:Flp pilus assembly complex ATPase component TadA [bacterium]|nr:Flp pilus assembly complex ATPase component TadA [bacterium]